MNRMVIRLCGVNFSKVNVDPKCLRVRFLCSSQNGDGDGKEGSSISERLAKPDGRNRVRRLKGLDQKTNDEMKQWTVEVEGDRGAGEVDEDILDLKTRTQIEIVAETLGGDPEDTKKDLTQKLVDYQRETLESSRPDVSIASMISEMEIEPAQPKLTEASSMQKRKGRRNFTRRPRETRESDFVRGYQEADKHYDLQDADKRLESIRKPFQKFQAPASLAQDHNIRENELSGESGEQRQYNIPDLFGGPGLGIFDREATEGPRVREEHEIRMPMWEDLQRRKLRLAGTPTPRNGFEEMIRWTDEGKMWEYPIDNEWGWEDEKGVGFQDHVFMESFMKGMNFPKSGPVRVFMEMVCTGMSKNPYMTVEKKRNHLKWFQEYFADKSADIQRLHDEEIAHRKKMASLEAPRSL